MVLTAVYKFYLCKTIMYSSFKGKDAIYSGLSDGLIVPFALATGMASAGIQHCNIFLWAIIAGLAGSIFMAIAGYFSAKATDNPEAEIKKLQRIFDNIGLHKDYQQKAIDDVRKEYTSLEFNGKSIISPAKNAWVTFISYLTGSFLAGFPYLIFNNTKYALTGSAVITGLLLYAVGYYYNRHNNAHTAWGALRYLLMGILAGAAAYLVANLFNPAL
jgi:VIT1/CCC1 family predicted Fe2+/Mn2+ transporter